MLQYVLEALSVLNGNRTRSFLTTLGLIIGVMAVISIQVLGAGMSGAVGGILGAFNDKTFSVFPNQRQGDFTRSVLKPADIARVKYGVAHIVEAVPAGAFVRQTRFGSHTARLRIAAESNNRFFNTPLAYGDAFTAAQVDSGAHVCLLTDDGYTKLKISGDPTGLSMRIGDRRFVIVGVLAKPISGILPNIVQGDIFIPYTVYNNDYARGRVTVGARFIVDDVANLSQAESDTTTMLSAIKKGKAQYQTIDRKSFASAIDGIFAGLTLIIALIGAVSLLVAGIGILNIMLVSVAERTREIGLRKAIGATRFQVLAQFFIEALLLSAIGCAIGLVFGLLIGGTINQVFLIKLSGVVAPIPWLRAVVIATSFATIVTLLFGTYPAYRAAKLDPIEALRYE
jgi:ABC-type antimicrobial peptide transport system permease subunit